MERSKTFIVISTYVDSTIKELLPDVEFKLFNTILELERYLQSNTIRADTIYITSETLKPTINSALTTMNVLLRNPFLRTDKVEYITSLEDKNTSPIVYMNDTFPVKWTINRGSMTRDYIYNLIGGTLAPDEITPKELVRARMTKAQFLNTPELQTDNEILEQPYESDEMQLTSIPVVEATILDIPRSEQDTEIINIHGIFQRERKIFLIFFAQYLSLKGKTVFLESDFNYLDLSDLVFRSELKADLIDVNELYNNTEDTLIHIKNCHNRLIFIYGAGRSEKSYYFLTQLLYHNLNGFVSYMISENEMDEINADYRHLIVFPADVTSLIMTLDSMTSPINSNTKLVALAVSRIKELFNFETGGLEILIQDIMQPEGKINLIYLELESLILGGVVHDLQMLLE